jgi:hypothetical protein
MRQRLLSALLVFSLVLSATVAGATFGLSPNGVAIEAGAIGSFNLSAPLLETTDQKELKPAWTVADDGQSARAAYANGLILRVSLSLDRDLVRYDWDPSPGNANLLKFTTLLPINLNQGGRFALGSSTGEFPVTQSGQFLAHGQADRLDIIHPLGDGLRISTPQAYQQLQDNRTWNWSVFAWIYRYEFARYPDKTSFAFRISDLAPDKSVQRPGFLVDRYGQSARKDWPGKVRSDEELRTDVEKQAVALGDYQGPALDRFGGLAGSGARLGLKASGFFYTAELTDNRQVLVTPEGNVFFQLGVCGITNTDDFTTVKAREKIYEWLPDAGDSAWKTAWRQGHPDWGIFSFQIANWIRKFGRPYSADEWTAQAITRLRAWGFNSAGAFGPYTDTMRSLNFPTVAFLPGGGRDGLAMLPDKLGAAEVMDPFAPGVEDVLDRAYAVALTARATDPLIIGYFLGNEQHFENIPKLVPGYRASKVPAKARLMALLRKKYGTIGAFNTAWAPAAAFNDFEEAGESPLFIRTDAAAADMRAYLRLYLDSYYGMIRRVFDRHDPNHLLIGSRWTPHTANNEDVVSIGGKYLDVISVNYYTYGIETDFLKKIHDWSGGRPLLLSEWYYSATDHGLGASKEVGDQRARGLGYRNYVEQSAATGYVVGSQWFIYADQAATGRFFEGLNGEGNNTGLVDVTDRPYGPLVEAARETHARIYDVLLGREKPFAFDDPRFSGHGGGGSKVVTIPRALPGLKLDGTTANWPGRPAEPIASNRVMLGNANPALDGAFRLCWDDQALHFLIQVKDPTPAKNNKAPAYYWSADGIELFIGHRNPTQGGGLQFSDRQLLLGAGPNPGVFVVDHPEDGARCTILVVKDVTGDGYTLQVRIPWDVLGITPRSDMELLFDVAIDNSDDGETRAQQLVWNGTDKNSGDRAAWGRARLVEN